MAYELIERLLEGNGPARINRKITINGATDNTHYNYQELGIQNYLDQYYRYPKCDFKFNHVSTSTGDAFKVTMDQYQLGQGEDITFDDYRGYINTLLSYFPTYLQSRVQSGELGTEMTADIFNDQLKEYFGFDPELLFLSALDRTGQGIAILPANEYTESLLSGSETTFVVTYQKIPVSSNGVATVIPMSIQYKTLDTKVVSSVDSDKDIDKSVSTYKLSLSPDILNMTYKEFKSELTDRIGKGNIAIESVVSSIDSEVKFGFIDQALSLNSPVETFEFSLNRQLMSRTYLLEQMREKLKLSNSEIRILKVQEFTGGALVDFYGGRR